MQFSSNPTVRAREVAQRVRDWYEEHRESMSEHWFRNKEGTDQFIHDLVSEVLRVNAEANPPAVPAASAPAPAQGFSRLGPSNIKAAVKLHKKPRR